MPEISQNPPKVAERTLTQNFVGDIGRYFFDFNLCTSAKGWHQYDTDQDAWYFGVWIHPKDFQVITYAEGDFDLVQCPDHICFNNELQKMAKFYGWQPSMSAIDTDSGTLTRYYEKRPIEVDAHGNILKWQQAPQVQSNPPKKAGHCYDKKGMVRQLFTDGKRHYRENPSNELVGYLRKKGDTLVLNLLKSSLMNNETVKGKDGTEYIQLVLSAHKVRMILGDQQEVSSVVQKIPGKKGKGKAKKNPPLGKEERFLRRSLDQKQFMDILRQMTRGQLNPLSLRFFGKTVDELSRPEQEQFLWWLSRQMRHEMVSLQHNPSFNAYSNEDFIIDEYKWSKAYRDMQRIIDELWTIRTSLFPDPDTDNDLTRGISYASMYLDDPVSTMLHNRKVTTGRW